MDKRVAPRDRPVRRRAHLLDPAVPAQPHAPAQAAPVAGQNTPAPAPDARRRRRSGRPAAAAAGARRPRRRSRIGPSGWSSSSTPEVRYVFSSLGGTLVHAQLREKQFLDDDERSERAATTSCAPRRRHERRCASTFPDSGFPTPPDGAWEASQPAPDTVVFAADIGNVHIEKRYRARQGPLSPAVGRRRRQPRRRAGGERSRAGDRRPPGSRQARAAASSPGVSANVSSAICFVNGSVERKSIREPRTRTDQGSGRKGDGHLDRDRREVLPARRGSLPGDPGPFAAAAAWRCSGTDVGQVTLRFPERVVAPKAEISYPFIVFAGPKVMDDLEAVQPPVVRAGDLPGTPPRPPPSRPGQVGRRHAGDPVAARSCR